MPDSLAARRLATPALLGWLGVTAAFAWSVLRSGTGILPGHEVVAEAAARWPYRIDRPFESFGADSPLNLIAFRALGLDTPVEGLRMHALAIVVAMAGLAWWAFSLGGDGRWRAARFALLAPVTTVMLAWIGSYDPFTVMCWVLALWAWKSASRPLMVAAGAVLGFQHFEHAALGLGALWLTWLAIGERVPRLGRSPLWLGAGILAGKAVLSAVFLAVGEPLTGRTEWIGPFLRDWTVVAINVGPTLLWSLFAGSWAIVIWVWLSGGSRARVLIAGAIAIGALASALSGDRPRVFILVLAPSLLLMAVVTARESKGRTGSLIEAVVWLAPPVLLWANTVVNARVVDLGVGGARILLGD